MADKLQEFQISYWSKPPYSDVSACARHADCPLSKNCLRAVVFNQQTWFGSWIEPEQLGYDCKLIISEKPIKKPQEQQKPLFKFRG